MNDRDQVAGADLAGNTPLQHPSPGCGRTGSKTALGTPRWELRACRCAINNRGQVVGCLPRWRHAPARLPVAAGPDDGPWHAARRRPAKRSDITDRARSSASHARPISAVPVLVEHGNVIDLNQALSRTSGWQVIDAQAINARGQITGGGLINGEFHAFLMTPVH